MLIVSSFFFYLKQIVFNKFLFLCASLFDFSTQTFCKNFLVCFKKDRKKSGKDKNGLQSWFVIKLIAKREKEVFSWIENWNEWKTSGIVVRRMSQDLNQKINFAEGNVLIFSTVSVYCSICLIITLGNNVNTNYGPFNKLLLYSMIVEWHLRDQ